MINAAMRSEAKNIGFGTNPRNGQYIVSLYLVLIKKIECKIRKIMFTQLPRMKPTGPNQIAKKYDAPRNAIDSQIIIKLLLFIVALSAVALV